MRWYVMGFIAALAIAATIDFDGRGSYLGRLQTSTHQMAVLQDTVTHNIHGIMGSIGPRHPFSGGR